jgi:hypothetical protein
MCDRGCCLPHRHTRWLRAPHDVCPAIPRPARTVLETGTLSVPRMRSCRRASAQYAVTAERRCTACPCQVPGGWSGVEALACRAVVTAIGPPTVVCQGGLQQFDRFAKHTGIIIRIDLLELPIDDPELIKHRRHPVRCPEVEDRGDVLAFYNVLLHVRTPHDGE